MRKRHTPAFKAQVVQTALKKEKTIAQIASENGIHPNQICAWKAAALKGLPSLFEKTEANQRADQESVALQKVGLPVGHPDIATSLNNVAELYGEFTYCLWWRRQSGKGRKRQPIFCGFGL